MAGIHRERVGYDRRSKYCGACCGRRKSSGAAVCLTLRLELGSKSAWVDVSLGTSLNFLLQRSGAGW